VREQSKRDRHVRTDQPSAEGTSHHVVLSSSSREYWQQLIDVVPDPMWVKDTGGKYVVANQAYLQADPPRDGVIIGRTDVEAFPSEKATAYVADDQFALRDGACEHEFSAVNSAGQLRYYFTKKAVIRDEHGSITAIVGIARDVTDHHRIEMELAFQARRSRILGRILESATTTDTVGPFLAEALTNARELLDYARGGIYMLDESRRQAHLVSAQGELADIQAQAVAVPADEEPFASVYDSGRMFMTADWRNVGPQVSSDTGALTLAIVPLSNLGRVVGSLNVAWHHPFSPDQQLKETLEAVAREIAVGIQRIQAANSWVESESNLHMFFDSVQEIVLVLDPGGRILAANEYAARKLGYAAETIVRMNLTDFRPIFEQPKVNDALRATMIGTRASHMETLMASGGDLLVVETTVTHGSWKSEPAVFSVSRDMTSQLRNEEQLKALSLKDPLTGLYNLRGFSAIAGQQLKTAHRAHISAAIVFVDVDTEGTPPDVRLQILRTFTSCLNQTFRDSDMTAFIGEGRFAVLAIQTNNTRLDLLVQRLDEAVEQLNRERASDPLLKIKAIVVPAGTPGLMSVADLLKRADAEMGSGGTGSKG
jgi:diguanylate cyclase (GGDEF)-like protein/PAS domain S-box-containing protein